MPMLSPTDWCSTLTTEPIQIAALFVIDGGPYFGLEGVDPWPESRDARTYFGPHPVVAHPPCERWGRYWSGGPMLARTPRAKKLGDDGGCFFAALAAVRRWGGVIEHPEASHAWAAHGLRKPPKSGGWVEAGDGVGWTCCVEQGHYGHLARKATWLYVVGTDRPELKWGSSGARLRLEPGFHSTEERRRARAAGKRPTKRLPTAALAATPPEFKELLLSLARSVRRDD